MQTIARTTFTTVKTEGGLLPADLLQRIADGRDVAGLRPEDYHLFPGERLNEAINRAWNRCLGAWLTFDEQRRGLAVTDTGTTLTRERWLLVLFSELGYGRLQIQRAALMTPDGTPYPISHLWDSTTPIHLVTFRQPLDKRSELSTQVKRSPHSLMQEFLNRSPAYQWGIIANGLQLRLLHDNASLRRVAYVEFDLEAMMTGELYAEFSLLWLVCHQSRMEKIGGSEVENREAETVDDDADSPPDAQLPVALTCWLDGWSKDAAEHGTRALSALRDGVTEAIQRLGCGFLGHPANRELRSRLQAGELSSQEYYQQLRRLVYRLIFLCVAEDRDLLLLPGTSPHVRQRYLQYYSLHRLRIQAATLRGTPHGDLYQQLRLVFVLVRQGYPALGLPGFGSMLFSERSTPELDSLELSNRDLLDVLRTLAFTMENGVRRPVDYRNLDSEELGSVYESLLELHPQVNVVAATFTLVGGAWSERKKTGSHYTPGSLVESLLDSALEPVVADRLNKAGNDPAQREKALLAIKVLDCASGSAHILIGAGRRLARHLARIRTGDDEPTPDALRAALRDVVRHCLYGVDLNETAVELCKVALWMETMEPGKPLSFLDKNIQVGNSLIGVMPGLDVAEIPDDAFQPQTGDDKTTATGLRKRNKREREGQLALRFGGDEPDGVTARFAGWRAKRIATLAAQAEDDVEQVAAKESAYAEYLGANQYQWSRLENDLWTAAFFWPIPARDAGTLPAPTQQVLRDLRSGKTQGHEKVLKQVRRIAKAHHFFHWALQFPDVFDRAESGFDVVLSNPPWDQMQADGQEFFAASRPDIANAPNMAARNRMVSTLTTEDPALYQAWIDFCRKSDAEKSFMHTSGRYPKTSFGRLNTAPLFAEFSRQVISKLGRVGLILPTGIATDSFNQYFFQSLIDENVLASLYDFENRRAIFPGVHHSYKFCLLTLRGHTPPTPVPAQFIFFALDVADLLDPDRRFSLTSDEIALLNPNTRTCPIFRSRRDAELTKAIYRRVPVLIREGPPEENPWGIKFMLMFMMNTASHLFRTRPQLEQAGWRLEGNRFVSGEKIYLPLYEAKMLHQYDHRWATFEGGEVRDVTGNEKTNPEFVALPRYWVKSIEVNNRLEAMPNQWLLGFRDIARSTDERTAIFALIPLSGVGNNAPLALSTYQNQRIAALLASVMSSLVADFVARLCVGGTHMNFFIAKQLAVLAPQTLEQECAWARPVSYADWLLPRVLELTYTAWDMQRFAQDFGYNGPPFRWDEERRFLLRAELDAAYFHLYGIARDDVAYILNTFPIVKRKEMARYGEYRSQRVILEFFDAMAEAMNTGVAYPTRLDPPPADPQVAHLPQTMP